MSQIHDIFALQSLSFAMEVLPMAFVEFKNVGKTYKTGDIKIEALKDVNFEIEEGEFCIIVGASGAGKTTILNILGGMDTLTAGGVYLADRDISGYSPRELTSYRRYDVGFVFQFYNLVGNLTAKENVELAAQICKDPIGAEEILTSVGLKDRMNNFPAQLSGGEQQRVATLDDETGRAVLKLLQETCKKNHKTVVVITHNHALTAMADRVINVKSGTVSSIKLNENPKSVDEIIW